MHGQCSLVIALLLCKIYLLSACPDSCLCRHEQGLHAANCSTLPISGGKIEILTLLPVRDNPLELSDGQFSTARHLKYLNLQNSSIYFIHKKAFYGAKYLIEINLSFNYIEDFEPVVFQHLTSLTTLLLRGNPLRLISEVPFLISNSLQHLDIGQCKLSRLPRGIFYGLKRLRYLSLDGNFLKTLTYNSLPKGLKYLNLSDNSIVNVPTEVISALTNLRRIGLGGNPINCSCGLMNLQDWLSGRGVIFENEVICDKPDEYYGISWSKVDENMLCLEEVRREEISHSTGYNLLFKNRLSRGNYYENENRYLEEDFQADQPQPLLPDSQAEVLFQNDETLKMGEMMRDEDAKDLTEQLDSNKDGKTVNKESDVMAATLKPVESVDYPNIETKEDNLQSEIKENKSQDTGVSYEKNIDEDSVVDKTSQLDSLGSEYVDEEKMQKINENKKNPDEHSVEMIETSDNSTSNIMEKITSVVDEGPNEENKDIGNIEEHADATQLNVSSPIEFKSLNEEDTNNELDDLKKEGLFHVDDDILIKNETSEDSTILPDFEETTEEEFSSTPETFPLNTEENNSNEDRIAQNITLGTGLNNETSFYDEQFPPEISENDTLEFIPPPVKIPDLYNTEDVQENVTVPIEFNKEIETPTISETGSEGDSITVPATDMTKEENENNVAGAEVVMFCVAVLLTCLILYSIYKCRNSKKHQSLDIVKDMESNCGTEMQDMASLLPKPQDSYKKNNKYPDKPPTSETIKLITEQNENEASNNLPDSKNNIEEKNILNNNTPSSPPPSSKTPLIKTQIPVTINPTAPIQRTKVKVGVLPDSIPRTPILIQKPYNNGTKHV